MIIKVGFGFDVHRLEEGMPLTIGGIEVPYLKGSFGHSDADVLVHAICDAILGAANLGDIGQHFPDNQAKYKGIDSKILLKQVMELIRLNNYDLSNIDSTVCLQEPKLANYIPKMKETLALCMNINIEDISIKATTTEKLSFVGRGEGISAYAVVLLNKKPSN